MLTAFIGGNNLIVTCVHVSLLFFVPFTFIKQLSYKTQNIFLKSFNIIFLNPGGATLDWQPLAHEEHLHLLKYCRYKDFLAYKVTVIFQK